MVIMAVIYSKVHNNRVYLNQEIRRELGIKNGDYVKITIVRNFTEKHLIVEVAPRT